MIPILYKGNETNFNHNGIGLLKDTLTCEVTEVRNGTFDLELVYPVTGPYFKDLVNNNIIRAKPNDKDEPHNFRISEIDKTLSESEITVYASTITNDLGGNMVKALRVANSTPQVILNEMKKVLHYPTSLNFISNITTIGSVNWELNNPLNLLVGEEGSLVDIFGGEIKRTDNTVYLYGRRGHDNVTTIRYAKNLQGFKMTENFQGKFTQILPYFTYEEEIRPDQDPKDGSTVEAIRQKVTIFGDIVSSRHHGKYPVNNIRAVDFTNNESVKSKYDELAEENRADEKTLKNSKIREATRRLVKEYVDEAAAGYFTYLNPGCDLPSINMSVDLLQIVDSEQYEYWKRLEEMELCDTVSVYIPQYDVDVLVKITTLKYDSLRERTVSIEAGSSQRTSLMDEVSGQYKEFTKQTVNDAVQNATAGIVNTILTASDGTQLFTGKEQPPDSAKEGDIWFKDVGDGESEMWKFDGVNWVRHMYKGFGDDVKQLVDDAVEEASNVFSEAVKKHDETVAEIVNKAESALNASNDASMSAGNALSEARAASELARESKASAISEAGKAINKANELYESLKTVESEVKTEIRQTKEDLKSYVTKTDIQDVEARISETVINQTNDKIELLASKSDVNNLSGKVSTVEGTLTTHANLISQKVSATDLQPIRDGLNSKVTLEQVNTQIDTKTSGITSTVNAVKGVLDGGISARNYAVNTETPVTIPIDSRTQTVSIGYKVHHLYNTHQNKTLKDLGFVIGDKYTIMFDIYAQNNTNFRDYRVEGYTNTYINIVGRVTKTIGTPDNPTRFVGTTTISNERMLSVYCWKTRFDLSKLDVTIKNFRIFKGEIAQDWYPAWEDQKDKLDTVSSKVTQTENSITSIISGSERLSDGRENTFVTRVNNMQKAIETKVSSTELTNKGYQTRTDVQNIVNNDQTLARKTDIPNTFGGRNMAYLTSNEWSNWYTDFRGTENLCPTISSKVFTYGLSVGDSINVYMEVEYADIVTVPGKTSSIYMQGPGNVTQWSNGTFKSGNNIHANLSGNGIKVFKYTFNVDSNHIKNNFWRLELRTDWIQSGKIRWRLLKIEKGPLWSAWSPAPEDTLFKIDDKLNGYVTNETYTSYTNDRRQTDKETSDLITKTVSKVPTGPVNLIKNGFDQQTTEYWSKGGNSTLTSRTHPFFYNSSKKLLVLSTSGTTEVFAYTNVFNIKRNTKYTLRLGLFNNSNVSGCDIYLMRRTTGGSWNYLKINGGKEKLSVDNVEYYTFTVNSDNYDEAQFRIDNNGSKTNGSGANLYICEVSCIEGEMNNSWSPSFDELITEQKFNETKSTVDSFVRAIGTREQNGIIPAISRQIITQDAFITEVSKYGQHIDNLIVDSQGFSMAEHMGGVQNVVKDGVGGVSFHRSGATSPVWSGLKIPTYVTNFKVGETYTISLDVKVLTRPDDNCVFEIKDYNNNKSFGIFLIVSANTSPGDWKRVTGKITIVNGTAPNTTDQGVFIWIRKNGGIAIRNLMMVKGDKIGSYSPSRSDSLSTRVEQTANSYAIKSIKNQNDIVSQLNVTNNGIRLNSSLIHLDGKVTFANSAFIPAATIKDLSATHIKTGTLDADKVSIINLNAKNLVADSSTLQNSNIFRAFIDNLSSSKISSVRSTSLNVYTATSSGHSIRTINTPLIQFHMDEGHIDLNGRGAEIRMNSEYSAIVRRKGWNTAFLHFNNASNNDGLYIGLGVTSGGDGINSQSSGRFAGVRILRTSSTKGKDHGGGIDKTEIYGDRITFSHGFNTSAKSLYFDPTQFTQDIDLWDVLKTFNDNFKNDKRVYFKNW